MTAQVSLYPYQRDAVNACHEAWDSGMLRLAMSLPTAGGKTIVFGKVAEERGERALIVTNRKEINDQAAEKLTYVGIPPADIGVVMAERNEFDAPIVVANIQTIVNPLRLRQLGEFGLVVVDEAHHASSPSYIFVLRQLGVGPGLPVKALGVSATWDRADKQGLDHVFQEIVFALGMEQLIASGHLSDIRALMIETHLDTRGVPGNGSGDFSANALGRRIVDSNYADTLAAAVVEHASDRVNLVFAPNVKTAHLFAQSLNDAGISAAAVNGETPRHEREGILERLQGGNLRAVVNCGVFTEGTDLPIVDCVVMGRPTKSRALYQQMAGRGLRRHPRKTDCLILDLVGNAGRHDLQSAASLLGADIAPGTREIRSFREVIENPAAFALGDASEANLGEPFRQRAKPIELIDRTRLAWAQVDLDKNVFSLSAGDQGQVVIREDRRGTFEVLHFPRDRSRVELGSGLDIGYAQGVAEAFVTDAVPQYLVDPNAPWRKRTAAPASEKQMNALIKWRIPFDPTTITKVEASALLDRAITQANLRRSA